MELFMNNVRDIEADTQVPTDRAAERTRFLHRKEAGSIAFDDTGGPGRMIIAIPGMGDLRQEYRHIRLPLAQAGFRVVTMDIRGHGESSVAWDDYSAKAVASDALALMSYLRTSSAILMGTSFAAGAAAWAAALAPDRVESIVMLGPILRDPPDSRVQKLATRLMFAGPWRIAGWLAYWGTLFPSRKPADHDAYRTKLRQNLSEPGRIDALKIMLDLSKAETEQILGQVRTPCLALLGRADPDYRDVDAEAAWIADVLGARVEVLSGLGHYPQSESPDLALASIISFLQRD
jgi:pimeloyl-ACP methyl ester carboxylesterase